MKLLVAALIVALMVGCSKFDNANDSQISYTVDNTSSAINSDSPFVLYSYPNPFRNNLMIGVSVHEKSKVSISFSNKKGYLQKVVDNYEVETGQSIFNMYFNNPVSGTYLCEVVINDVVERLEFINM